MPIDPNTDFEGYLQEQIQSELAKAQQTQQQTQQQAAAVPNEPLSLNIAGQQFTYGSKAEMEQALNRFAEVVGSKINELEGHLAVAQTTPNQQGGYVQDDAPGSKWDDAEFVKRMTESPKAGLDYWLNQTVFDGKSDDPSGDLKRNVTETELTKRSIAAYQFKENHPEFPGGAQAAQVIDNVRQSLNLPYDYNGLEAAYLVAMQRNALPNFYAQQAQAQLQAQQGQMGQGQPGQQQFTTPAAYVGAQPQRGAMSPQAWNGGFGHVNMNAQDQAYAQNPYLNAPPSMSRNNTGQFQPQVDPESLSLEQLESIFARSGHPVQHTGRF